MMHEDDLISHLGSICVTHMQLSVPYILNGGPLRLATYVGSQQSGDHVQQNMKLSYPTPHKTKTLTDRTTKFRVKRDEWWEGMPIPKDPTVFFPRSHPTLPGRRR